MSARLLYGKPVVESIRQQVSALSQGINKKLCLVGFDEPRWNQYAGSLMNSAEKYGFKCENIVVDGSIEPNELADIVDKICARDDVCGVMLQQPLDKRYNDVLSHIVIDKDVDCLNPLTVSKLYYGKEGFRPATPQAVINLLDYYNVELKGKNVVVVGRGNAVGKPLALMLLQRNATITVCHTKTVNLPSICRQADVIISACGVAGLITSEHVTERSVVIDVGLSFVDGKTRGDVSDDVYEKCAALSPVPGGVGPITRATLFQNLLRACKEVK